MASEYMAHGGELMAINTVPGRRNEDLVSIQILFLINWVNRCTVNRGYSRSLQVLRTTNRKEIKSKTNTCKNAVFKRCPNI